MIKKAVPIFGTAFFALLCLDNQTMFRRNISSVEKILTTHFLRSVETCDFDVNFNHPAYQTFLQNVNG